ncbi:MAG: hypothetical protein HOW97_11595 [Catenulispora sp.]|nr:hypothetical protein [Catenulispora sp.]
MAEDFAQTAVGYEFPTANWLDPFDVDEAATQRFLVNQDRISRAWVAPVGDDRDARGWGFGADEPLREVFTNPRSCLYCLEKVAVVAGGQVLREWAPTAVTRPGDPNSCAQHNGLYFVYSRAQRVFPVHEAVKYADYDEALTEALAAQDDKVMTMVARMVDAESLW